MAIEPTGTIAAAKAGDPRAIAALINRSLSAKGIQAKVSVKSRSLSVFLEAEVLPTKETLAPLIQKGISGLKITAIQNVKLYGRRKGADMPDWQYQFQLDTYIEPATEVVAVEVVSPRIASLKTTQSKKIKTSNSRRLAINPIIIFISGGVGILLLVIGIWLGLIRNSQAKNLEEAQDLLEKVVKVSYNTELAALKSDQSTLLLNQEKLEGAIKILEETPSLPFWNIDAVNGQMTQSKQQLSLTQTKVKEVEQEIVTLERLIPIIEEVRDSFAALDSSLDVGMSYVEYGDQVRQIKVAIDKLARQKGASDYSSYKNLNAAFEHYDFGHDVWKYYIESDESHNFFPVSNEYGSILINNYGVTKRDIIGADYIYLKEALTQVWSEAGKHVKLAQEKL